MKRIAIFFTLVVALAACSKKSETQPPVTTSAPAGSVQESATPQLPPGHPAVTMPPAAAAGQAPSAPASVATLTGKVLETMDSGGYTYVKLKTGSGDVWAAVNQSKVKVGQELTIVPNMTMENFESKTLNRKFDKIIFATVGTGAPMGGAMGAGNMAAMGKMAGSQNPHAGVTKPAIDASNISVPKAEGSDAKTIAEVWGGKASLKDKPVTVRGKVVKYLPGIMGKNWIHLRDGSGSEGTNDLTITTTDVATAGDVVTVKGTVHTDVDFGAGYSYAVIIEDGKVTK